MTVLIQAENIKLHKGIMQECYTIVPSGITFSAREVVLS